MKTNGKKIRFLTISAFATFFLFSLFLIVDNDFLKNKFFANFSISYNSFLNRIFGSFGELYIILGLFICVVLLIKIKRYKKISLFFGITLLLLFISSFTEFLGAKIYNGGLLGKNLSKLLLTETPFLNFSIYFLWGTASLFLILLPIKNILVKGLTYITFSIIQFIEKLKDYFGAYKNELSKERASVPFISKIVYEDDNKITEIPIFSIKKNDKPKKFVYKEETNTSVYYEEEKDNQGNRGKAEKKVDSTNSTEEYFKKLKEHWPEKWKHEENNEIVIEDSSLVNKNEPNKRDIQKMDSEKILYYNESNFANKFNNREEEFKNSYIKSEIDNIYIEADDLDISIDDEYDEENYDISHEAILNKKDHEVLNKFPNSAILSKQLSFDNGSSKEEEAESSRILEATLFEFGIKAEVVDIIHGPVVTLYKLIPAPGIKLSRIEGLSTNLALRLAAQSIRIIAPIPGEKVVGIEIPNRIRELVSFSDIINSKEFKNSKYNIPIGLGKDIYGNTIVADLYKMPHILIAGATGAGKSVCVNGFISSILFSKSPEDVRLILIDPKIVELKPYNNIPHLLTPVITESKKALMALKYLLYEMERRYSLLDEMGVRDIVEYRKMNKVKPHFENLPFIVAFVDEFADLMTTSGKDVEIIFSRLAAKARAIGILLVLATQRPSADVITGLIKANIPSRIAFQVISLQDSRIILDQKGAEKLLGQGDMLYLGGSQPFPIRVQGAYLSKDEVDNIANHWKELFPPQYVNIEEIISEDDDEEDSIDFDGESRDPLFDEAVSIVKQTRKASASYLQRRLSIGYNRAARLVEEMEEMGIVGPQRGAKAREVIGSDFE